VDAGRELSAIALGKRAQMPYVWPPRRDPCSRTGNDDASWRHPIGATADGWQFLTP